MLAASTTLEKRELAMTRSNPVLFLGGRLKGNRSGGRVAARDVARTQFALSQVRRLGAAGTGTDLAGGHLEFGFGQCAARANGRSRW